MKIGFIETLRKINASKAESMMQNVLRLKKRTSVHVYQEDLTLTNHHRKRLSHLEQVKLFVKQILPKMQESIELDILKNQFKTLKNDYLVNNLISSYIRRRLTMLRLEKVEVADEED